MAVVIGPSRSGKATLCQAPNRLETIRSGTVRLVGRPLPDEGKASARLRADVGMVFQPFNLFVYKTVPRNVSPVQAKSADGGKEDADRRSRELPEGVGVAEQADKYPAQLSDGQRRGAPPRLLGTGGGWRSRGCRPWNPRRCSSTSRPRPSTRR